MSGFLSLADGETSAEQVQRWVALAVISSGLVLAGASSGQYVLLLGPALAWGAHHLGAARKKSWGYYDPFLVGFGSFSLLLLPQAVFSDRLTPGNGLAAILTSFGILLLWALQVLPAYRRREIKKIRSTTLEGVGIGFGFCLLAAVIVLVRAPAAYGDEGGARFFGIIFAMYLGGGAAAGAAVGVLQRLSHWPAGRMLMGVAGTTIVYTAAGGALMVLEPTEFSPDMLLAGPALGGIMGPAFGIGFEKA